MVSRPRRREIALVASSIRCSALDENLRVSRPICNLFESSTLMRITEAHSSSSLVHVSGDVFAPISVPLDLTAFNAISTSPRASQERSSRSAYCVLSFGISNAIFHLLSDEFICTVIEVGSMQRPKKTTAPAVCFTSSRRHHQYNSGSRNMASTSVYQGCP